MQCCSDSIVRALHEAKTDLSKADLTQTHSTTSLRSPDSPQCLSLARRPLSASPSPSSMPSYSSLSLPRSLRLSPVAFLPLPLPLTLRSPPLLDSKPPPVSSSTEPPPPPNHITTFLSTLLNLRSSPASRIPISFALHSPSSLYPSLMKSLSLSGRPDLALLLFLSLPSPASPQLLSSFLHSLSLAARTSLSNLSNSHEAAYSAFFSIEKPDAIAFGSLIAVLCTTGHIEEALGVFDLMLERGVLPTARTCTCILKAYCVEGRVREAQRFIHIMENGTGNGLLPRPDVIIYTVYIEGLCLVCDFDSVEQVLKQAEEEASRWKPNSVTYNVYISGLCRAGMLSEAFHQVDTMRKKGLQPTIETLNILFDCLCRDPSTVYKAKELLERSGELEWEVDSFFYNTLMSRLLKMGEPVRVLKPLTDMVKKGIKPDICCFTTLARGLCKAGKFRLAKFIITRPEIKVDVTAYNTLLHEMYVVGDLQQQKLLYLHMLDRNVYPSKFTVGIMIDCLCKEGKFLEAMNYVIGFVRDKLFGPDLVSWLIKRLVAYGRLGDVLHLLTEMSKRGIVLNPPLFDFLIEVLCRKGYCKGEEFYRISLILDVMLGIT